MHSAPLAMPVAHSNTTCLSCADAARCHCAPHGRLDKTLLAHAHLEWIALSDLDPSAAEDMFWAFDCLFSKLETDAELGFASLCLQIDAMRTPYEAAALGAGVMNDLLMRHGLALIDRVEQLAERSARFMIVLDGVWQLDDMLPEVAARVERLIETQLPRTVNAPLPEPDRAVLAMVKHIG